jgi:hypothetical protein
MPGINPSVRHAARRQFAFVASAAAVAVAQAASADVPAWNPATPPPPYVLPTAPTVARDGTVSAIADNSNSLSTYGPAVTFGRTSGASYSGIGTTVLGTTLTVGTTTTTPIIGSARPQFGSSAWIRAGQASSDTTVSMQWRTATQYELYGSSTSVEQQPDGGPLPDSGPWNTLGSDVLKITGIAATGSLDLQGRLPTDAYTLEMTFDPAIIVAGYQNYSTFGWTLSNIIAAGELQMGYFNPQTQVWTKGINVISAGASRVQNYQGTWDAFALATGANDANLASFVGSWGLVIDNANPTNSRMWAVLDHTSSYAVVPAPGALALLGAAGLVRGRRRR